MSKWWTQHRINDVIYVDLLLGGNKFGAKFIKDYSSLYLLQKNANALCKTISELVGAHYFQFTKSKWCRSTMSFTEIEIFHFKIHEISVWNSFCEQSRNVGMIAGAYENRKHSVSIYEYAYVVINLLEDADVSVTGFLSVENSTAQPDTGSIWLGYMCSIIISKL